MFNFSSIVVDHQKEQDAEAGLEMVPTGPLGTGGIGGNSSGQPSVSSPVLAPVTNYQTTTGMPQPGQQYIVMGSQSAPGGYGHQF